MDLQEKIITAAEFYDYINLPENADQRFELINGEIQIVPSAEPIHAQIIFNILLQMGIVVRQLDAGWLFSDSVDFYLPNGDVFIPNVSFTSKIRQPTLPKKFEIVPDRAVEVASPSNSPREMLTKVESYIASGTKLVWVIYPKEKIIDVWRSAGDSGLHKQKFDLTSTLDGGEILPGFSLPVKDVFQGIE